MVTVSARPRVLVAGLGNIFLGDDAFGVEVVRRLSGMEVPDEVRILDIGLRSLDLAYELAARFYDIVILVDVVSRGGTAGTLYVLEPDDDDAISARQPADGHAIHPQHVVALVHRLGGRIGRVLVVGCEPARVDHEAGLSPRVAAAVGDAVTLVWRLMASATDPVADAPA